MQIGLLYDQGTAKEREDQHVVCGPFVAVADGVSAPYETEPVLYGGYTDGAWVAESFCGQFFLPAERHSDLFGAVRHANDALRSLQTVKFGKAMSAPDTLAGASCAVAKIGEHNIEMIQTGDAIVCWRYRNGRVDATRNQVRAHDEIMRAEFARLLAEHGGDRRATWQAIYPLRLAQRRQDVNGTSASAFGLMTDQEEVGRHLCAYSFLPADIMTMILCTDGFVDFESTGEPERLAHSVFTAYDQGGLTAILAATRASERAVAKTSHITHGEATAVAIEF